MHGIVWWPSGQVVSIYVCHYVATRQVECAFDLAVVERMHINMLLLRTGVICKSGWVEVDHQQVGMIIRANSENSVSDGNSVIFKDWLAVLHSSYQSLPPLNAVVYFFQARVLFSIENTNFWPILAVLSQIYAFLVTFISKNMVVYQNVYL